MRSNSRRERMQKLMETALLDREEEFLRGEGATTMQDVEAYYDRHYPHASKPARDVVTTELYRRLQTEKEVDTFACRLPTNVRRQVRWTM